MTTPVRPVTKCHARRISTSDAVSRRHHQPGIFTKETFAGVGTVVPKSSWQFYLNLSCLSGLTDDVGLKFIIKYYKSQRLRRARARRRRATVGHARGSVGRHLTNLILSYSASNLKLLWSRSHCAARFCMVIDTLSQHSCAFTRAWHSKSYWLPCLLNQYYSPAKLRMRRVSLTQGRATGVDANLCCRLRNCLVCIGPVMPLPYVM